MCKCGSFFENCLCYTCKNRCKECCDCDICESGDMVVFACNHYEENKESEE